MLSAPETPIQKPLWKRLFKGYLIYLVCFWAVILWLAFWWDFLPQSVWFVAPILLIVLALIWLARKAMVTPQVVLTVSVLLVVGAVLTAIVHLTGAGGQPWVGYIFLTLGLTAGGLIRWWRRRAIHG
jgi:hypothetical protein